MNLQQKELKKHGSGWYITLLCYIIAFSIPLLWLFISVRYIYPYRLSGTAPKLQPFLSSSFSGLSRFMENIFENTGISTLITQPPIQLVFKEDLYWLGLFVMLTVFTWFISLVAQICWRIRSKTPWNPAKSTQKAIVRLRITFFVVFVINILAAVLLWGIGIKYITGKEFWDYAVYYGALLLTLIAFEVTSRFAAPSVISGYHSYFIRL